MLDSPFCFVESSENSIEAYCLSFSSSPSSQSVSFFVNQSVKKGKASSTGSSATSSAAAAATGRTQQPSVQELAMGGYVHKMDDQAAVEEAFRVFLASPRLITIPEDENYSHHDEEDRDYVVPVHCTMACYSSSFDKDDHMGKMLLTNAFNFPSQRFGVPAKAKDMHTLLQTHMKELRIFNIYVQHNSLLIMKTFSPAAVQQQENQEQESLHSCTEWNLTVRM